MKIKVEKVTFDREVLKEQTLEIGKITLIKGDTGSGKTTLLKQIQSNYHSGYLSQDPDNQLVCDKVWHELAFGMENLGIPTGIIRARVAEVATYLGIENIINRDTMDLSGGQKQKVCLASVLCTSPQLILLDEPTSMLDPIAAREFWSIVERLSRDKGVRFIVVEHNTYPQKFSDVIYHLQNGILHKSTESILKTEIHKRSLPDIYKEIGPIRKSIEGNLILNINKLILREGLNFVIGPNGVGKTTLLNQITGFGEKKLVLNSVLMPQDVKMMFYQDTVKKELSKLPLELELKKNQHPMDLSGGEQHILAVYKTLERDADLYCFDEPTKGMDSNTKHQIMDLLKSKNKNMLIVSHDLDLVAEYADNVIFLFNKEIASEGTVQEVLSTNLFYTPEEVIWK